MKNMMRFYGRFIKPALSFINPHICRVFNPYTYMWSVINRWYIKKYNLKPLTLKEIIKNTKKSDTIFIFGSGYSINEISKEEWNMFRKHNTLSFNWFHNKCYIPIDYYIVREIHRSVHGKYDIENVSKDQNFVKYLENLNKNCYKDSILFINLNMDTTYLIIKSGFLRNRKYIFYANNIINKFGFKKDLSKIYHGGIYSGGATLLDAIHISYIMGFKKIVLVGVDLYDSRYFWLNRDENRDGLEDIGKSYKDVHRTYPYIIKHLDDIVDTLKKEGTELYVYNSKSLLAKKLPIYKLNED
ncbi:hypothetical protein [Methanotorris formicicus]|uniref:DUF115 domain-containing protein n=1 Tax=Methanotorris formicicus Mc-S-70 TaxID=647171 RepID=H1KWH1_9EURY|nr:hypothetical protein [Methanotorris formicicus]EHP89548.1 hypothetical protein MetfoDRAFT_0144 [Methanotorris formicicus Mc-S-70]